MWGAGMSEWIDTTIGEQVTLQRGMDITKAEQRPGYVPVISSGGISSFHDTSAAQKPGVILGRKGVIGSVYFVDRDYWPHDTTLWVKDFHGNEPRFVYYFFRWLAPQLAAMDVGSANPTLNRNHVHPIEVRWPKQADVQRAIAHILGTLDDKIELNRRTNETLEAMARAIFKSWFANFDPVRAKASGEPPESICRRLGLTPDILDLFPNSLKESEIGEIPSEWAVATVGKLAEIVGGGTPSTKDEAFWNDGQHYWATPKDLSKLATPVLLSSERKITNKGLAQIGSGLLPPGTVLLSSRAPIGYRAIAEVPIAINQGFIAMQPNQGVSRLFLLYWAEWAHQEIVSRANGSTFLEISKGSFRPIPVVTPPASIFGAFDQLLGPIYQRMVCNERETIALTEQRDTLLPQLLSGEIGVPVEEIMS